LFQRAVVEEKKVLRLKDGWMIRNQIYKFGSWKKLYAFNKIFHPEYRLILIPSKDSIGPIAPKTERLLLDVDGTIVERGNIKKHCPRERIYLLLNYCSKTPMSVNDDGVIYYDEKEMQELKKNEPTVLYFRVTESLEQTLNIAIKQLIKTFHTEFKPNSKDLVDDIKLHASAAIYGGRMYGPSRLSKVWLRHRGWNFVSQERKRNLVYMYMRTFYVEPAHVFISAGKYKATYFKLNSQHGGDHQAQVMILNKRGKLIGHQIQSNDKYDELYL